MRSYTLWTSALPLSISLVHFSMELNSHNILILFSIYLDCFSDFVLESKLHEGIVLSGFLFNVILFVAAF